jgi:predicted ATPase with chaperone activity
VTGVTVVGVRGNLVAVEAHVGRGLPWLTLTGLPSARVSPEDVAILERMMGVEAPNQERLQFLGG